MKIDLHSHSTCSDGSDTPSELVNRAHQAGVEVLALTDHDTILGVEEAQQTAAALGMTLIRGVEISCEHTLSGGYGKNKETNKIIHVLGLDFQDCDMMQATLTQLQQSRANRGRLIVDKLADIFALNSSEHEAFWQAVLTKAGDNPQAVGRAHIAQVWYAQGRVKTVQQAFDKYLADNKPGYVAIDALSMEDGIKLIQDCGGQAVLAHPTRYRLSATRVRKLISEFAQLGGNASELPNLEEPLSTRQMVDRCVANLDLKVSIGSDYHGRSMPWRRLGDTPLPRPEQIGVWQNFNTALS